MFANLYICLTLSDIYNTIGRYMSDKRHTLLHRKYIKIVL